VNSSERIPLERAFSAIKEELRARRIIEAWAERPTGEILDYVYFHTAPMRDARRGEPLDFRSVLAEPAPTFYVRSKSKLDPRELKQKQRALREAMQRAHPRAASQLDPPPRYDQQFWQAVEALDSGTE
jgi:hypothetical protein